MKRILFSAMIGIAGTVLLIIYAGWMATLGLYLLLWSNNMDFRDRIRKDKL